MIRDKNKLYDWVMVYWMPYDNNLSHLGPSILNMLARGVQTDNVLVLVQSDFYGSQGHSRRIISKNKMSREQLEVTDSGSEEVFSDYLYWATSQFSAKRWAIIFLGHGGRLDELSPDEHPKPRANLETTWMNIEKLNQIMAEFGRSISGTIELLFLQNCCKGTIEAHLTFREAAKYTLSSQMVLGAPNYYYDSLLRFMGYYPELDGGQLAEKVMAFERIDMYDSYTVTKNLAVGDLPTKINALIDAILAAKIDDIDILKACRERWSYRYMGDQLADVVSFFEMLVRQSGADRQALDDLMAFLNKEMIYKLKHSPTSRNPDLSGLSLYVPLNRRQLGRYSYLQLFSEVKLMELFSHLIK